MAKSKIERALLKVLRIHDMIYQASHGWIGHRVPGAPPSLLLRSVGAKTGAARTNTLTYAKDGDKYLIVASNAGAKRYPAWYHNVKAHPDAEINVGPRRFPVTARIVGPEDADYQRLWEIADQNNNGRYSAYQERTSRPITVIELTPKA
jgi:deazaflavin-dependent oxidoreductase (nitroreductase family)